MVQWKANGETYATIGNKLGVSRQRVQQMFSPRTKTMKIVAARALGLCETCGHFDQFGHYHHKTYDFETLNNPDNIVYLCTSCHRFLVAKKKEDYFCLNCGRVIIGGHPKFCSSPCRKAYNSVTHECSNCHKVFSLSGKGKIRISKSKSGLIFCSKHCQGTYMALHYGFAVHPEHMRYRKSGSKYSPMIPEIIMRQRIGEAMSSIYRNLGIPRGTESMIRKLIAKYKSEQ